MQIEMKPNQTRRPSVLNWWCAERTQPKVRPASFTQDIWSSGSLPAVEFLEPTWVFRDVTFGDAGFETDIMLTLTNWRCGDFTSKADTGEGFLTSSLKPHILKNGIPEHPINLARMKKGQGQIPQSKAPGKEAGIRCARIMRCNCVTLLVWRYLSNAASFVLCVVLSCRGSP